MHTSIYFGNEISEWKYKELIDGKDSIHANDDLRPTFIGNWNFP
jgi:hypothetical protein